MSLCDCYVDIIHNRLNLLISETFQLDNESLSEIDFNNHKKIVIVILREIENSHIKSAHFTPNQAGKAIALMDIFEARNNNNTQSIEKEISIGYKGFS